MALWLAWYVGLFLDLLLLVWLFEFVLCFVSCLYFVCILVLQVVVYGLLFVFVVCCLSFVLLFMLVSCFAAWCWMNGILVLLTVVLSSCVGIATDLFGFCFKVLFCLHRFEHCLRFGVLCLVGDFVCYAWFWLFVMLFAFFKYLIGCLLMCLFVWIGAFPDFACASGCYWCFRYVVVLFVWFCGFWFVFVVLHESSLGLVVCVDVLFGLPVLIVVCVCCFSGDCCLFVIVLVAVVVMSCFIIYYFRVWFGVCLVYVLFVFLFWWVWCYVWFCAVAVLCVVVSFVAYLFRLWCLFVG